MKTCILCGKETYGSVGAAGIEWSCICQPCKDKEDETALNGIKHLSVCMSLPEALSLYTNLEKAIHKSVENG